MDEFDEENDDLTLADITEIEVEYYIDNNNKIPFDDWYNKQNKNIQALVDNRINRILFNNFGDTKKLTNAKGIFELKFRQGIRIYYGKEGQKLIIILAARDKSSQSRDIKKAIIYWEDYHKRQSEGEKT